MPPSSPPRGALARGAGRGHAPPGRVPSAQCIRLRAVPPLPLRLVRAEVVLRRPVPALAPLLLVARELLLRVLLLRLAVFLAAPAFAVLRAAVRRAGAAFFAVVLLARVFVAAARDGAFFAPAALPRVEVAALPRLVLAALRVLAALPRVVLVPDAALRRVAVPLAALRVVALRRPPFAAAAVRPAAPRAVPPDALRAGAFFAVALRELAAFALAAGRARFAVPPLLRRAGARRRFGCSSVAGCSAALGSISPLSGIRSVSSLMRCFSSVTSSSRAAVFAAANCVVRGVTGASRRRAAHMRARLPRRTSRRGDCSRVAVLQHQ